ncbi:MAG: hypothetical protein AB2A00_36335 [Myxococcota bacterium]
MLAETTLLLLLHGVSFCEPVTSPAQVVPPEMKDQRPSVRALLLPGVRENLAGVMGAGLAAVGGGILGVIAAGTVAALLTTGILWQQALLPNEVSHDLVLLMLAGALPLIVALMIPLELVGFVLAVGAQSRGQGMSILSAVVAGVVSSWIPVAAVLVVGLMPGALLGLYALAQGDTGLTRTSALLLTTGAGVSLLALVLTALVPRSLVHVILRALVERLRSPAEDVDAVPAVVPV